MKIGNQDIRRFAAKQLTVDIEPPKTQVKVELPDGALMPSETETYTPLANIKVGVLFRGETRNEIVKNVSDFNALLQRGRLLTLDGYERKFMGFMQDNSLEKTITAKRYMASFNFSGYWQSDEVELEFINTHVAEFDAAGNKETPCKITIIALESMAELTINGFDDEIMISSITRGKEIIIDGIKGIVTEDGVNKFNDVDLWQYPYLKVGENKSHSIIFSSNKLLVKISYNPLWV